MMRKELFILKRESKILIIFFLYPLILAFFIQLIVLPLIFPQLHAGNGLLKGLDSVVYHEIALEEIKKIDEYGFSVWQLAPKDQRPAGFISLIYYITNIKKPLILIPIFTFIHGLGAFIIYKLINLYTSNIKYSIIATLPFLLYPSSILIYSQILKDGFYITGYLLILYGILRFFGNIDDLKNDNFRIVPVLFQSLMIILGFLLIWIMRPYGITLIFGGILLCSVFFLIKWVFNIIKMKYSVLNNILVLLFYISSIFIANIIILGLDKAQQLRKNNIANIVTNTIETAKEDDGLFIEEVWNKPVSDLNFVEYNIYKISDSRYRFFVLYPEAGSTIDKDVRFHSVGDMIKYVPRAIQIALFAPFPNMWFSSAHKEGGDIQRIIVGIENIVSYIILFGTVFFMLSNYKKIEMWAVLVFCLSLLLVYAMSIPNIGALYRMKYGFYSIILSFGVIGWINIIKILRNKKNNAKSN